MEAANPIPHATDAPRVVLATQAAVEHIAVEAEAKLNGNGPVAQIEPSGQHTGAKRKSVWHKGKRSHADPEAQDAGKALQLDTSVLADAGTVANEKADTMTEEELVQRRLAHVQQLYKLYKVQHWSALEELRTRHQHFYQTHQRTGWKDPSVVAVEPAQKGSPARSLRSILRSRPATRRAAGGPFASPQLQGYREKKLCDLSDLEAALQGEGSDEEAFTFSDAEEAVLELDPEGTCADKELLAGWRCAFRTRLTQIARLEQSASAASARDLDSQSALAALCGRKNRFLIRRTSVTLGRTTETHGQVDVDLSAEGDARKVSRQQAQLTLMPDGKFLLQNTGRRSLFINGRQVDQAQVTRLDHLSVIEAAGIRLLFMVNHLALRRVMTRSANFTV
ncbi:hypothetical protein WJX72_000233 [[Myrmecia] bisecta]|uniref:FHA domain-containing protein n=1 Tax=[Myrmecia] bisecta TaxID=41462 RepID=A0AAW1PSX4_9CHLO